MVQNFEVMMMISNIYSFKQYKFDFIWIQLYDHLCIGPAC
jgi:hypothetical protein